MITIDRREFDAEMAKFKENHPDATLPGGINERLPKAPPLIGYEAQMGRRSSLISALDQMIADMAYIRSAMPLLDAIIRHYWLSRRMLSIRKRWRRKGLWERGRQ